MNLPLSLNKRTFKVYKKEDRFNKVYDSDGEPGPFCDMEYLEDNKYFVEYALPDAPPHDAGKNSLITKVMNLFQKEEKYQKTIHPLQCMLKS